jgi:hypothetical protein
MKVPFRQLFSVGTKGQIQPLVPVHINGVTMTPGVSFGGRVLFGGVDLAALRDKDLEVDLQNGIYFIKSHY